MPARLLKPTQEDLQIAAGALRSGELVAMPTETVYGLAGVAFDEHAVASIFAAKERPSFDPLICHVPPAEGDWLAHLAASGLVDLTQLSEGARTVVRRLAEAFWPGPLTLVLPRHSGVPDLVTSGLATVGVRCPRHPIAQQLLRAVGAPLAAPSANRFGRISPTSAQDVITELGDRIAYVLDGGACDVGIESTVLLVSPAGELVLLRPGGVSREQLEAVAQRAVLPAHEAKNSIGLLSPGLLASHYAPRKPLRLLPQRLDEMSDTALRDWFDRIASRGIGILMTRGNARDIAHRLVSATGTTAQRVVDVLSPTGNLEEAARTLFAKLRALDEDSRVDQIWAETFPARDGLAHAINDRLQKASWKER